MLKQFLIIITIILLLSCITDSQNDILISSTQNNKGNSQLLFSLEFEQNGNIYFPQNHIVTLSKNTFKLRFYLENNSCIFANFSQSPILFDAAINNQPIDSILGFVGTGMAEPASNTEYEVILTNEGWHVWDAPSAKSCRFHYFRKSSNRFICDRTIENFYDLSTHKIISLSNISQIYFVYCDVVFSGIYEYKINQVEAVKIIFE